MESLMSPSFFLVVVVVVVDRFSQRFEDFTDFVEMAWPTMNKYQRNSIFSTRLLMYEMDVQEIETLDLDG